MDLRRRRAPPLRCRFPRARGDGPVAARPRHSTIALPPRSRGWTRGNADSPASAPASPALAGMDPRHRDRTDRPSSFPRARGDGPESMAQVAALYVLPPRSRGWTLVAIVRAHGYQASPALAGMDPLRCHSRRKRKRFPRARGDGPLPGRLRDHVPGLPPRSRGWTPSATSPSLRGDASPALAGMDPDGERRHRWCLGFPRARGDGPTAQSATPVTDELPPRSRGWTRSRTRSERPSAASPALAGMDPPPPHGWTCAHGFPRARGDGPDTPCSSSTGTWLPPRSRGWTRSLAPARWARHASPALAGMDPHPDRPPRRRNRFPRARGDGPVAVETRCSLALLPPRSR